MNDTNLEGKILREQLEDATSSLGSWLNACNAIMDAINAVKKSTEEIESANNVLQDLMKENPVAVKVLNLSDIGFEISEGFNGSKPVKIIITSPTRNKNKMVINFFCVMEDGNIEKIQFSDNN